MCRLMAYLGDPITGEDLVTRPTRSIIRQSFDARERLGGKGDQVYEIGNLNADGFGLGWYVDREKGNGASAATPAKSPCVIIDTGPAWNNRNLNQLAPNIRSSVFFAHVRAAGPGMGVCQCSCHPFVFGHFMFMHNGLIGDYEKIKRPLLNKLGDVAFDFAIQNSCSDSALAFAIFINQLDDGFEKLSPERMRSYLLRTVEIICEACDSIRSDSVSLMNFVVTDGTTMAATRYIRGGEAGEAAGASLYFTSGTEFDCPPKPPQSAPVHPAERGETAKSSSCCTDSNHSNDVEEFNVLHSDHRDRLVIIASEPITDSNRDWVPVPNNHMILVANDCSVLISPMPSAQAPAIGVVDALQDMHNVMEAFSFDTAIPRTEPDTLPKRSNSMRKMSQFGSFRSDLFSSQTVDSHSPSRAPTLEQRCLHRLTSQHSGAILSMASHNDLLITSDGSRSSEICVWNTNTWECIAKNKPLLGSVLALFVDQDKQILLSASRGAIQSWCLKDVEEIGTLPLIATFELPPVGHVLSLVMHGSELFFGSQDATVRVTALEHFSNIESVDRESAGCNAVAEATNEHPTHSGSGAMTVPMHLQKSVRKLKTTAEVERANRSVRRCSLVLRPSLLQECAESSGEHNFSEEVVINDTDEVITTVEVGEVVVNTVEEVVVDTIDDVAAKSSDDVAAKRKKGDEANSKHEVVVKAETFPCFAHDVRVGMATSHCGFVYCCVVLVHQKAWCSGGGDGLVKVWNWSSLLCEHSLEGHRGAIMTMTADNATLFTGSKDATIRVWDLESMACKRTLPCSSSVLCLAIYDQWLVAGTCDGRVCLWERQYFTQVAMWVSAKQEPVHSVQFIQSSASLLVAVGVGIGEVYVCTIPARSPASQSAPLLNPMGLLNPSFQTPARFDASNVNVNNEDVEPSRGQVMQAMVATLADFVSIPSVSANPMYSEQCWSAAKFTSMLLEQIGCKVKLCTVPIHNTEHSSSSEGKGKIVGDGLPVVLGRIEANPSTTRQQDPPTVTFYAHYDVVDVVPEDWTTGDPWTLHGKDGFLYGRGSTDNKGPLVAMIFAVAELHRAKSLECNVMFVVEGQEEAGMSLKERGFDRVVRENEHWFHGTEAVVISNNYWLDDRTPCLTYGMRGVVDLDVTIHGPLTNLHAGVHGGPMMEPMVDLIRVLEILNGKGEVSDQTGSSPASNLATLNDGVRELDENELKRLCKAGLVKTQYTDMIGVSDLKVQSPEDILRLRWCSPSLSVSSIKSSNVSHSFRKIPCSVSARLSFHFVPDQDANTVTETIISHITNAFNMRKSPNKLKIDLKQVSDWWLGNPDKHLFKVAKSAVQQVWGMEPVLVREGGSFGGITPFLEMTLNAPALHLPMGQASDQAHLADERIRLYNLDRGLQVVKKFLQEFPKHDHS